MYNTQGPDRFSLRILVAGEKCNVTGEYFERGQYLSKKIIITYLTLAGELSVVNRKFSDLQCLMKTLRDPAEAGTHVVTVYFRFLKTYL